MRLPAEAIERRLDTWPVAILASVDTEGRPHQVPVVFARAGSRIWSPVDAKPKVEGELARVRHLRADPRASLLLEHYAEDWKRLWWLRVESNAQVVEPRDPSEDPEVELAVAALRRKYPQYREIPVLRDPPTLLALDPIRVTGWCASREAISML
jgi:PPOX class probable F420-dependent enzyme